MAAWSAHAYTVTVLNQTNFDAEVILASANIDLQPNDVQAVIIPSKGTHTFDANILCQTLLHYENLVGNMQTEICIATGKSGTICSRSFSDSRWKLEGPLIYPLP